MSQPAPLAAADRALQRVTGMLDPIRAWEGPTSPRARLAILFVTGVLGVLALVFTIQLTQFMIGNRYSIAVDFNQYRGHTARWLETGQFYLPHQLQGDTTVMDGDPLYPPIALYLLVPFQWLPAILWWVIPLGVITYVFIRLRPRMWTWPIIALLFLWPRTPALILYGNPGMWVVAAVAAGLLWRWPAAFVLLKPSLAPFALIGIRSRLWWVIVAAIAVVSIPLLPQWLDYFTVLRNSHVHPAYSALDLPFVLAPIVAWLGSSTAMRTVSETQPAAATSRNRTARAPSS